MGTAGHSGPGPFCAGTRWALLAGCSLSAPRQLAWLSTSLLLQTAGAQGHPDASLSSREARSPARWWPLLPPALPWAPSSWPCAALSPSMPRPGPRTPAPPGSASGAGGVAGGAGVPAAPPTPPHPQTLQGLVAESEQMQSLCRQARVPRAQASRRGAGDWPAISCPSVPMPSFAPPQAALPQEPPLCSPPPAWPAELGCALTCAALLAPEGPRPRTCGRRCKIQFAADTSSRHPGPEQPAAPWLQSEDAAAAPTQGSAHHLAPQACLAAVPTLPQGRISQALGKKVSRNAELRRIVQPEAVFGAKQPGSGMLQTLCSRRRTGGWGWGAGERGAAEQEAASCRPFWNSEAMDSACPGAWCVQPPAHKVLSSMGAWEGQR